MLLVFTILDFTIEKDSVITKAVNTIDITLITLTFIHLLLIYSLEEIFIPWNKSLFKRMQYQNYHRMTATPFYERRKIWNIFQLFGYINNNQATHYCAED